MPRYRFAWDNFPPVLLKKLALGLSLDGAPTDALRRAYGARPKPNFIQDAWPVLLESWLPTDHESRAILADALRDLGLGRSEISIRRKQGQLDYLRTCRNAPTLREVTLAVLLAAGERQQLPGGGAEVRVPPVRSAEDLPAAPLQPSVERPRARSAGEEQSQPEPSPDLNAWMEAVLCRALDLDEITRDEDGDIPIPRGSTVLFIRKHNGKSPFVEVFAPLLQNFRMSAEVYEAMNALNSSVPLAKATVNNDGNVITLSAELLATTLSASELMFVVDIIGGAADHFDTMLQKRFGGNTLLSDQYDDSTDF